MDQIKELKSYIENIKPKDKIALFYHGYCGDGVCSAVITTKVLERMINKKPDLTIHQPSVEFTKIALQNLIDNKITHVIFVDLMLNKSLDVLEEAKKSMKILVIDHHDFKKDFSSENLLFIHSTTFNKEVPSNFYPASKLTYDLFSKIIDIEDIDWISCLGTIFDRSYPQWKNFIQSTMKKYNVEVKDNIEETEFWQANTSIGIAKKFDELINETFDTVYNAKSYKDILNNETINDYKKKFNKEFKYWLNKRNEAEKHGDLIIFEIKPKYRTASTLSSVLSFDYFKGKTLVVIEDDEKVIVNGKKMLKISARDQIPNVRVNDLLEKAVSEFKDSMGGGHAQAAGGLIRKEDLNEFKNKLIKVYNELIKR